MTMGRWMDRFGVNAAIAGDIVERSSGRSRLWVCRQAVAAIALSTVSDLRSRPWHAAAVLLVGWTSLLLFFTMGDRIANAPGKIIWNWTVEHGYDGLRVWWFRAGQYVPVSYLGFALSGWIVSRFGRPTWLLAYAVSVFAIIAGVEATIEYVNRPLVLPYKFIVYVLTPSVPLMWRSGLALLPVAVLFGGFAGLQSRNAVRLGDNAAK
ncbi:MAG TPA: hypothetical protein VH417_12990 [Vicinamibacterales bacterium]|jgi:hypothetical protein